MAIDVLPLDACQIISWYDVVSQYNKNLAQELDGHRINCPGCKPRGIVWPDLVCGLWSVVCGLGSGVWDLGDEKTAII